MEEIFEVKDKDLLGRIGVLHTRSGKIETPAFFPVIHPYRVDDSLTAREIISIGFKTLITNAYLVKKYYGERALREGLKKILDFDGVLMTDSGAYQIMLYGSIDISNREIVEYQANLDQDIAVILDVPTTSSATYDEARRSVEETLRRAREVIDIVSASDKLWVLPIQGGAYEDLVLRSVLESVEIPGYSIYGIGSPVTYLENYDYEKILSMIALAKKHLSPDKPVHLFGAGHPMIIPFIVALGIDLFDSASYILYARDNRYLTEYGTERLEDLEEFPCTCPVCSKYTPRDLMEMSPRERIRLLATHNLYVINREIKRTKVAIREGRLWELITERSYSHPSLRELMKIFVRERDFIEKYSPSSKGRRGLLITDLSSLSRPIVYRARERSIEISINYVKRKSCTTIALIPRGEDKAVREDIKETYKDLCVIYYTPFLGVYIAELVETYPYSHYEIARETSNDVNVMLELARDMERFLAHVIRLDSVREIVIYYSKNYPWSSALIDIIKRSSTISRVAIRDLDKRDLESSLDSSNYSSQMSIDRRVFSTLN
ncbi:MAG: tRNA guanosine(15) transglycosylase TgtA [Sulfolobales archaeon]